MQSAMKTEKPTKQLSLSHRARTEISQERVK